MTRPAVDHGLLSPSGHISKRSMKIFQERMRQEIFKECEKVEALQETEHDRDLRRAKNLRHLAMSGMKPRAYLAEAVRLEEKWK